MKQLVYLAHPVRDYDDGKTTRDRAANIEAGKLWLKWFLLHTDWSICAHWLSYCVSVGEYDRAYGAQVMGERGMSDDIVALDRCDGIVLCGGRITAGMAHELEFARAKNKWVLDLTGLGRLPPGVV